MRTEKIAERLARTIIRESIQASLSAGSSLPPESVMLANYKVGRASLREALRILEVAGIVNIRPGPGGGPVLAGVDPAAFGQFATLFFQVAGATVSDLVEARLVLEPLCARLAAQNSTPGEVAELMRVVEHADPSSIEDSHMWLGMSTDFHGMITRMSGNPILDLFAESIRTIYAQRINSLVFPAEDRVRIDRAHRSIVAAISQHNADRAEKLMRQHMEEYVSIVRTRFDGMMEEVVDWK